MRVIQDKTTIEVAESKERLELFQGTWLWPICDPGDFCEIHGYVAFCDNEAEVLDGCLGEEALFWLQEEVVFLDSLEDLVRQVTEVVKGFCEDQDVIYIHDDMAGVYEVFKCHIHEGLEGSWGVAEPEEHNSGLKEPKRRLKGGF